MTTFAKYGVSRAPFAFLRRKSVEELENRKKWHQIFETGRVWPTVVPKRGKLGRNRRRQKIRICQLVIVTKYQGPTINTLEAVAKSP